MNMKLPSGTVTFLFTDIENSTRLWEGHPQEMRLAHARHNQILRNAIEANHGYVFQVVGDAFYAAFHAAGDAARAAVKCQLDLTDLRTKVWTKRSLQNWIIEFAENQIQKEGFYGQVYPSFRLFRILV